MNTVVDASARRPATWVDHLLDWIFARRFSLLILAFVSIMLIALLWPLIIHNVPAGHVGVLWKRFGGGTVLDRTYEEGVHIILPWNRFEIYDVRLKVGSEDIQVLASDGLTFRINLTWRFNLLPHQVPLIHKYLGPNYESILLTPTITGLARDVVAMHSPDEIYTEKRLKIADQIERSAEFQLRERFNPPGMNSITWLDLQDVLIKDLVLPEGVQAAIVRKNAAFHEMEEWTFRIQRELKEVERKRTEALGIRQFQEIVSNGMNEPYLRWRGIEATLDLAKSPNAKVVVVGNNRNGLPLILNTDGRGDGGLTVEGAERTTPRPGPAGKPTGAAAAEAKPQ